MTPSERHEILLSLDWTREIDPPSGNPLTHPINSEPCNWYSGQIAGIDRSAWIGTKTGKVYLHSGGDHEFEEFCEIVRNGWPVAKVTRGFDFGDD